MVKTKSNFSKAFDALLEDKQLPKDVILEAIESAMASAYRRAVNASSAQAVEATIDLESGDVVIYAEKEVVEDVQDVRTETTLENALKYKDDVQLGDMAMVESTPENFGRVAAQTARQVIQQRIREAERSVQAKHFEKQVGEIVSGIVQASGGRRGVTVGLDMKAEGTIPHNQKIPGEKFRVHDRIRCVVLEVKDSPRGPQIILSRGHGSFLRRLMENEVPEIYHGIVEIRGIAREPGRRAKVSVAAMQEGIDPVGACVGIRGVRIQNIVRELHNEKIDIIEWNPDQVAYISKAISPARVTGVYLSEPNDATRTATVVVTEDQLSLAIGRNGQNARLAAKLTGWRIDIKSLVEAATDAVEKLKTDKELAAMMPKAVEQMAEIEAMLAKKAEGRSLSPEEYQTMTVFMDRVERRTIEVQEEADRVEQEKIAEIRSGIPEAAFDMELANVETLMEHVFNILFEAEFDTVGDLMLALQLDPDQVFSLPGIGPKAVENITEVLAGMDFPEVEVESIAVEADVEEVEADETADAAEADADLVESAPDEEGEEEVEEQMSSEDLERLETIRANVPAAAFEMKLDDAGFSNRVCDILVDSGYEDVGNLMVALQFNPDQVFDLPNLGLDGIENLTEILAMLTFPEKKKKKKVKEAPPVDDDLFPEEKKKQRKKYVKYEYDPELGEVVAQKRRKKGDEDEWDEEDW